MVSFAKVKTTLPDPPDMATDPLVAPPVKSDALIVPLTAFVVQYKVPKERLVDTVKVTELPSFKFVVDGVTDAVGVVEVSLIVTPELDPTIVPLVPPCLIKIPKVSVPSVVKSSAIFKATLPELDVIVKEPLDPCVMSDAVADPTNVQYRVPDVKFVVVTLNVTDPPSLTLDTDGVTVALTGFGGDPTKSISTDGLYAVVVPGVSEQEVPALSVQLYLPPLVVLKTL